jgi:hypothetical protein
MKIYKSDMNFLIAEINGKNIHSKYNPEREAERFINAYKLQNPSIIILLGAGLGYIQKFLIKLFPDIDILAIFYDIALIENCFIKNKRIKTWYPDSGMTIESFFNYHIQEEKIKDIAILEWNPCSLIYPKESIYTNRALKEKIQQLNGNIFTTAVFGKKWIRNMITNYLSIENYLIEQDEEVPVVIASSGPTLIESIEQIKKYRKKFRLWALPSSLKAFEFFGITPDRIITTDPGYYGSYHLQFVKDNIPVALPLTASRGLWKKGNPAIILNQVFPFEKDLSTFMKRKIYFTGLDLCFSDIQSHIKPHSFDSLLASESNRLNPIHKIYFNRASSATADFKNRTRTSRALDTYKNWLNIQCQNHKNDIKRLNPSVIKIDNMRMGYWLEFNTLPDLNKESFLCIKAEIQSVRKKKVLKLLNLWDSGLREGTRDDLSYFIDTESFLNNNRKNSVNFINQLRGIYG